MGAANFNTGFFPDKYEWNEKLDKHVNVGHLNFDLVYLPSPFEEDLTELETDEETYQNDESEIAYWDTKSQIDNLNKKLNYYQIEIEEGYYEGFNLKLSEFWDHRDLLYCTEQEEFDEELKNDLKHIYDFVLDKDNHIWLSSSYSSGAWTGTKPFENDYLESEQFKNDIKNEITYLAKDAYEHTCDDWYEVREEHIELILNELFENNEIKKM